MRHTPMFTTLVCTLALAGLSGCGEQTQSPPPASPAAGAHAHEHPSEGPHHGQLIELGNEEYHAELVHDDTTNQVTIYLLDGAAKQAVASDEQELVMNVVVDGKPQQFKLAAAPDTSDSTGKSSRFQTTDKALCQALEAKGVKARLNVTLGGKPLVGEFEPAAHSHDHDHDAHNHDHK